MQEETVFAQGMIIKKPSENSPDFVLGKISIKVEEFIKFLQDHNNQGWVNLDLLTSKTNGNPYAKLDTWKPKEQAGGPSGAPQDVPEDNLPF